MHFQMESLENVLQLIKSSVFMAFIDLKDDFYCVPEMKSINNTSHFLFRDIYQICMHAK